MTRIKCIEKVLGTVCFNCCKVPDFPGIPGSLTRMNNHPDLGGKVDVNGACSGCPVAAIRGDGAPISAGQKDKVFGYLVPGPECERNLTPEMTWKPCEKCAHATVVKHNRKNVIALKDLDYCVANCIVKEIRDALNEIQAERSSN